MIKVTSEDMATWGVVEEAIGQEARRLCRIGCNDGEGCQSCVASLSRDFRHEAIMNLFRDLEEKGLAHGNDATTEASHQATMLRA